MDNETFKQKMKECSTFFQNELSKERLAIYWQHLEKRYTNDIFINKIDNIIDHDTKFPLLADIHQASEHYNRRDQTNDDSPGISKEKKPDTRENIEKSTE